MQFKSYYKKSNHIYFLLLNLCYFLLLSSMYEDMCFILWNRTLPYKVTDFTKFNATKLILDINHLSFSKVDSGLKLWQRFKLPIFPCFLAPTTWAYFISKTPISLLYCHCYKKEENNSKIITSYKYLKLFISISQGNFK